MYVPIVADTFKKHKISWKNWKMKISQFFLSEIRTGIDFLEYSLDLSAWINLSFYQKNFIHQKNCCGNFWKFFFFWYSYFEDFFSGNHRRFLYILLDLRVHSCIVTMILLLAPWQIEIVSKKQQESFWIWLRLGILWIFWRTLVLRKWFATIVMRLLIILEQKHLIDHLVWKMLLQNVPILVEHDVSTELSASLYSEISGNRTHRKISNTPASQPSRRWGRSTVLTGIQCVMQSDTFSTYLLSHILVLSRVVSISLLENSESLAITEYSCRGLVAKASDCLQDNHHHMHW